MIEPTTYLIVPGLLLPAEIQTIESLLQSARYEPGDATATEGARAVKHNLQLPEGDSPEKQQVSAIIHMALAQSPLVQNAIAPVRILPPIISRYEAGMQYGYHVDSPLMANMATGPLRTDVAMTLFLSDPDSYAGGELSLITPAGERRIKLPKGDAVIYPCTQVHAVLPVTAGVRSVAVTWMQCVIRDAERRALLFQIRSVQRMIEAKDNSSPENVLLLQVYSNLMRMWAEI